MKANRAQDSFNIEQASLWHQIQSWFYRTNETSKKKAELSEIDFFDGEIKFFDSQNDMDSYVQSLA